MKRTLRHALLCFLPGILFGLQSACADIPETISYQGQLRSGTDQLVNATLSMTFCLYQAPSGGTSDWCETHGSVTVDNGSFSVDLGSVTPFEDVNFDTRYYLGIQVGADAEMTPRMALSSVPSAYKAADRGNISRTVNCNGGDTITQALDAGANIITIQGMCAENVMIWRDDVTLQPDTGTAGPHGVTGQAPAELTDAAIQVLGGARVFIRGITVTGHAQGTGISIDAAGSALIDGVTVQNAGESGLEVCCNSAAFIEGGSTFSDNGTGINISTGGSVEITATTVTSNANHGINFEAGTAYIGDEDGGPGDVQITNNGGVGLQIYNSTVYLSNTTISGNAGFTAVTVSESTLRLEGGNAISHPGSGSPEETMFVSNGRVLQFTSSGPDTITSAKGAGDRAIGAYRFSELAFWNAVIDGGSGGEAILLHNKSIGEIQGANNDIIGSVTCSSTHAEYFDDSNAADSTNCP